MSADTPSTSGSLRRRSFLAGGLAIGGTAVLTACTSNATGDDAASTTAAAAADETTASGNPSGKTVKIGFSAPAADHGWMAAITDNAKDTLKDLPDVKAQVVEGTNDVNQQISQVQTLINAKMDAIVILPFDGSQLTAVARKAADAGILVVNCDRIFDNDFAYRTYIGGDNYGMGMNAGTYIGKRLKEKGVQNPVIAEVQGIASLPLTQQRSKGFADALKPFGYKVSNQVAADFTADKGNAVTTNLLQAAPKIDALWNHDDDQGVGVLAAIQSQNRDEFFMVGGAGSANMMRHIKSGDSVVEADVIYPSTQSASAIQLARLLVLGEGMAELKERVVPKHLTLFSAVVTKDNVDQYLPYAFES